MSFEAHPTLIPFNSAQVTHKAHLDNVLRWEKDEGWEILQSDIDSFIESKEVTLYLVMLRTLLETICVGSISVLSSPDPTSLEPNFIGLGAFIIDPAYRRQGIGTTVLQHCLSTISGKLFALLCMPEKKSFYMRAGFTESRWSAASYSRTLPRMIGATSPILEKLLPEQLEKIAAYDHDTTAIHRESLVFNMLQRATIATYTTDDADMVTGYAFARPFSTQLCDGFRLSLYANNNDFFKQLLNQIIRDLSTIADAPILHITIPTNKAEVIEAEGFHYEGGPYPFMRQAMTEENDTTKLYGPNTWCLLTEEFS